MTHEMCSTCSTWPKIRKDWIILTSPVVAIKDWRTRPHGWISIAHMSQDWKAKHEDFISHASPIMIYTTTLTQGHRGQCYWKLHKVTISASMYQGFHLQIWNNTKRNNHKVPTFKYRLYGNVHQQHKSMVKYLSNTSFYVRFSKNLTRRPMW